MQFSEATKQGLLSGDLRIGPNGIPFDSMRLTSKESRSIEITLMRDGREMCTFTTPVMLTGEVFELPAEGVMPVTLSPA